MPCPGATYCLVFEWKLNWIKYLNIQSVKYFTEIKISKSKKKKTFVTLASSSVGKEPLSSLMKNHSKFHYIHTKYILANRTLQTNIDLLKFNNINTRKRCEICSKFTVKTPERRQWRRSGLYSQLWIYFTPFSTVSIDNFEQVSLKC